MTRTPPSRQVVAAEVRAAMARADMTQSEMVDALKVHGVEISRASLSERLACRHAFNTDHLAGIAAVLGVDVFSLMTPPESVSA